jgi:hypothetical protein
MDIGSAGPSTVKVKTSALPMSPMRFDRHRVLQGNTTLESAQVVDLVLTEGQQGDIKATVMIGSPSMTESSTIQTVTLDT